MAATTYSPVIPLHVGYFVYRLWSADGECLYVGRAGSRNPVPVTERLRRHAREKPWVQPGVWADVCELQNYSEAKAEEKAQILILRPVHNVNWARCRAAGHWMDGKGRCLECRADYNARWREEHPHYAAEHYEATKTAQEKQVKRIGIDEYRRRHAQWSRDYRARKATA